MTSSVCGCKLRAHGSAIACLRIAPALACLVMFQAFSLEMLHLWGFLIMARQALQPSPKRTGAEELPVPKLSLALRHMCRQGVGEAKKGAKHLEAKGGDDLLRNTCQVHPQLK